jgi:Phage integrase family
MPKTPSRAQKPKVANPASEPVGKGRRYLRPEEANRLIAAAGKRGRYPDRDKLLVRLTYRHGLRASEAVGLRWDLIDLDGGTLEIRRSKGGKTSTHTMARDDLGVLRKMCKQTNGPWVFESERGGQMSVDALQYIVREAGKLAGLGDAVHPHTLRHGAGYSLINQGHDVRLVQDFLGHKNIASTAIYTRSGWQPSASGRGGAAAVATRKRLTACPPTGVPYRRRLVDPSVAAFARRGLAHVYVPCSGKIDRPRSPKPFRAKPAGARQVPSGFVPGVPWFVPGVSCVVPRCARRGGRYVDPTAALGGALAASGCG